MIQLLNKTDRKKIDFEPITEDNIKEAMCLKISENQTRYVESVEECLAEAEERRCWRAVGICDDDKMVGFAMYGYFWDYLPFGRVWLDRFLIDERFQGQGYGRAAMEGLIHRLDEEYGRRKIYLSVVEGNETAERLYREFGFQRTGERDIHGERVMRLRMN